MMTIVAALAGRRIDAADTATVRFPLDRVENVRIALEKLFQEEGVELLVCSAACGADLLALEVASKLGIAFRIVLPFDSVVFRETSVTDRAGDWGALYDRLIDCARANNELVLLDEEAGSEDAYHRATETIVREARTGADPATAIAITVWEGQRREGDDATVLFRDLAAKAGMLERTVLTCSD